MRIKELRESLGLSTVKLAECIGTSQQNISRWENNLNEPSYSYVVKLADYFNVTVDYLLERSDVPNGVVETFSKTEKELIGLFRLLSPFEQEGIMIQIKALAKAHASV